MARTATLSQVLWSLTTAWLAACGRLDFDAGAASDAPGAAAPAPHIEVAPALSMTTTCGVAPAATALVVKNTGSAALVITRATTTGPFTVDQVPAPIAPGEMATIGVKPPRAVVGTDRAGQVLQAETLTLETNAGTWMVRLDATVVGANVDLVLPPGATSLAFKSSSGCPAPQDILVMNSGNLDVGIGVSIMPPSVVAVSGFSGGPLTLGRLELTSFRPLTNSACAASGVMRYQMSSGASGLCTPPIIDINVTLNITGSSTCACS